MNRNIRASSLRRWTLALGFGITGAMGSALQAQELCGGTDYPFPYTDVASVGAAFCPGIMEAYVTGVSKGTTPTTFSPSETVTRVEMTTFLQRSLDQALARGRRRAALSQWWVPQDTNAMQAISMGAGSEPVFCAGDGRNIWISALSANQVIEVQASTGEVLGTWTGAFSAAGVVVAAGKVFVAGSNEPGSLYEIDPTQSPGPAPTASSALGDDPFGIAFDGTNIWTANSSGSVSIVELQSPYTVTTVTTGFSSPNGILFDGANIWVTDQNASTLLKLNSVGAIIQTVPVGTEPDYPVFDGTNIWVPNVADSSITVVQASTGNVVTTITKDATNNLSHPTGASFDGVRILITNSGNNSVSMFKAADLSFIANVSTGSSVEPFGTCSDGVNFWVTLSDAGKLLRF